MMRDVEVMPVLSSLVSMFQLWKDLMESNDNFVLPGFALKVAK